jgi:hypothetical protein
VASFLAFRCGKIYNLLFEQSSTAHLESRANNAIYYAVTSEAIKRPGISEVFFCLHSLDGTPSVDQFKFRMGLKAKPVRQRVVFHPLLTPLVNRAAHSLLKLYSKYKPGKSAIRKAEGIIRFYLDGKLPPEEQEWPECILEQKSDIMKKTEFTNNDES